MFPNEKETIDFSTIKFSDMYENGQPFSMEHFKTSLDGDALKLDFTTAPVLYLDKEGIPHEGGGRYLDICGQFTLTAELDGETLASLEKVTIKPYASFHTMWEIYDDLNRLAEGGHFFRVRYRERRDPARRDSRCFHVSSQTIRG